MHRRKTKGNAFIVCAALLTSAVVGVVIALVSHDVNQFTVAPGTSVVRCEAPQ